MVTVFNFTPRALKFITISIKILLLTIISTSDVFAQNQTLSHTVKKGETVYSISRQYNVNPKDVLDLNPKAGNLIYVNDVLLIPNTSPATSRKPISV